MKYVRNDITIDQHTVNESQNQMLNQISASKQVQIAAEVEKFIAPLKLDIVQLKTSVALGNEKILEQMAKLCPQNSANSPNSRFSNTNNQLKLIINENQFKKKGKIDTNKVYFSRQNKVTRVKVKVSNQMTNSFAI